MFDAFMARVISLTFTSYPVTLFLYILSLSCIKCLQAAALNASAEFNYLVLNKH